VGACSRPLASAARLATAKHGGRKLTRCLGPGEGTSGHPGRALRQPLGFPYGKSLGRHHQNVFKAMRRAGDLALRSVFFVTA
jgi:hypothetical protein